MKIVFAGTPEFAVPCLKVLLDSQHTLVAVYTQPDRPAGRGRKLRSSPVKMVSEQAGITVKQPQSLRTPEVQADLAGYNPDLMVVVAYGLILPEPVLGTPGLGCVNVHASLLPRWRGAAPIQRAILAGDRITGVSLMQMEAGLDTGPVLATARCTIGEGETGGGLHDRLAELGANVLADRLDEILDGRMVARQQDDAQATYAGKITKAEARLDWHDTAVNLDRKVRAFNPWPVAQTVYQGQVLRIWQSSVLTGSAGARPGDVMHAGKHGIDVACGEGGLRLLKIQLPGGKVMNAADFINAHQLDGVTFAAPG